MNLLSRFTRPDYKDGEDFLANYSYTAPENFNFARDVIDEYARLAPDQVAMIWTNDAGEERIFTFAELSRLSVKAANALLALGVQKGEPVLLMLKRRYEYWLCALGLMRIGAIQIPATHQLQEKDITYRVNAADARTLICVGEEELLSHVRASKEKCPHLRVTAALGGAHEGFEDFDRLLAEAPDTMDGCYDPAPEDVMLIYFTSGTTGMPKMLAHDFRYGIGHLITGAFWHNLTDKSIHITTADSGWAKCGWGKFYGQWIAGAVNFIYDFDRFNAQKMLAMLAKYHVTSFCAPPTIYRFLIKEDFSGHDLSALQWATCAGEPLNPEVYNQFYRLTGVKIHEAFGQSETTPLLVTHKWMEPIPGSTGVPSPHYHIRVVDATGRDVERGEEGELCIDVSEGRPCGLFMGYYKDPEQTRYAFRNGMYHTGDMVWADEEGYYHFIGRADDVIKSSGYRIGPFEVESALISHPAVIECAITGVPDPVRGQVVKATVVLVKGYEPTEELKKELQNHVKHVTAPYKYPRIVEFVDELPKTVSGKIQRARLRKQDAEKAGN